VSDQLVAPAPSGSSATSRSLNVEDLAQAAANSLRRDFIEDSARCAQGQLNWHR